MIKILLVDDEREEREGIAFLIEKYKYPLKIICATNGKEALEYIRQNHVDILFTDVKMPVMDGLDLAEAVYQYDPDIKIIIFSAYGEFEYAKKALEANAVSYLLKPIELDEFQSLMENVISSIRLEKEEKKFQRENEEYHFNNLLYKVFVMAQANTYEKERIQDYLFEDKNKENILIHVEFMNNYFDSHGEAFVQYANMYLKSELNCVELCPNEAYLVLKHHSACLRKELSEQLRKFARDIHKDILSDNPFTIIVSGVIGSLEELFEQREKIILIQRDAFGYHNEIIWVDDYYNNIEHYDVDIETFKKELLIAIDTLDIELIRSENTKFIHALETSGKISRLYTQNMLYTNIKALYDKLPVSNSDEVFFRAEQIFLVKELKTAIMAYKDIFEEMLGMVQIDTDESELVQKIKSIIEQEYKKDISLDYIADKVKLSPAYVSYLFKKESGQTLVKYITDKKMERAKKLLENRNLKVVQVAKACGYENQSYFNKLFKNYFGVTPKQYRDSL